jgi:Na+/H+-dicarboxylate symporter
MIGRSTRILAGLVLGLASGAALAGTATGAALLPVARPIGRLWLDALTMTVVPLIFSLLVDGIMSAAESAGGGRVATRALAWFGGLLLVGCAIAAGFATIALDFWPVPPEAAALLSSEASVPAISGAADWVGTIIPANPIRAAADTAIVPVVVFALFFGFSASRIAPDLRNSIRTLFKAIVETMLGIVHWVLLVAPIGVLALAFAVGMQAGTGAAGLLVHYIAAVVATCLLVTALAYPVVAVFGRLSPAAFARAALPAQAVAVSTQSSLASLPTMIDAAPRLDVRPEAAGIVLPLAVSVFRAASAAANVTVAVYLAHLHGIDLGIGTLLIGVAVAALVSVGAVGLPAQVSFFAIIGPVCLAMGVPIGLLPLLLAVETIPDIFRTLGNVTADLAVARLAGHGSDAADQCSRNEAQNEPTRGSSA